MYKINEIAQTLAEISDQKLIERFLNSILTTKEVKDISSRWELVKLLESGMSQRNISKELQLSLCKITRGSRELKKEDSAFKKIVNLYYNIAEKNTNNQS